MIAIVVVGAGSAWIAATSLDGPVVCARGACLGMTPNAVRRAFVGGDRGSWQGTQEGGFTLTWSADTASNAEPPEHVQLEFHDGMLVAIRAHLAARDPLAAGEPLATTDGAVIARRKAADGLTDVTVLARSCPTHAAEVARLLSGR